MRNPPGQRGAEVIVAGIALGRRNNLFHAGLPQKLIALKALPRCTMKAQCPAQHPSIFQGHIGALSQEREHRMRGVSD